MEMFISFFTGKVMLFYGISLIMKEKSNASALRPRIDNLLSKKGRNLVVSSTHDATRFPVSARTLSCVVCIGKKLPFIYVEVLLSWLYSVEKSYSTTLHSPPLREPPMRRIRPLCFNFFIW